MGNAYSTVLSDFSALHFSHSFLLLYFSFSFYGEFVFVIHIMLNYAQVKLWEEEEEEEEVEERRRRTRGTYSSS